MGWKIQHLLILSFSIIAYSVKAAAIVDPRNNVPDPFSPSNWPLPHNITGYNSPGNWGGVHIHDPSIVIGPDGQFYSFSTHDLVSISRAPTLEGYWEHLGSVLVGASKINLPGNNDTWAPDVHLGPGGLYYCFYSVSTFGSQDSGIGLATSRELLPGTWTDHGLVYESGATLPSPANITNAIDPNLFIDYDGTPLLTYGSFWSDIWQWQLEPDLSNIDYKVAADWLSLDPSGTHAEEGSYLHVHGWYYYLFFSHGICCGFNASDLPPAGQEYDIRVGRSKSPKGSFVDMNGTNLLDGGGTIIYGSHDYVYAPGGEGVLSLPDGRDVIYFHYIPTYVSYLDIDKLLGWDYLDYVDDWPVLSYD